MKVRRTITLEVEADTGEQADALMGDWYRDIVIARTPSLGQYTVYPIAPALVIVDAARHVVDVVHDHRGGIIDYRLFHALQGLAAAVRTLDTLEQP